LTCQYVLLLYAEANNVALIALS